MSAPRDRVVRFPAPPDQRLAGWRFAGGELLLAGERLRVGDADVPLSPMVWRLLCALLRQPGQLYTRAQAFETLWPGGGLASDEALAQIVARLRAALVGSGLELVTLRARGYRLEGAVTPLLHDPTAPAPAALPPGVEAPRSTPAGPALAIAPAAPGLPEVALPAPIREDAAPAPTREDPAPAPARHRRSFAAALLAVLLLCLGWLAWRPAGAEWPALQGLGIDAAMVRDWSDENRELLRLALAAGARGERAEQRQLLLALIDSEASSPLPVLLLSIQDSAAGVPEAARWRALLGERAGPAGDGYWPLLVRTVLAVDGDPRVEIEALDAALALRPDAFDLRFARAHAHLRLRQVDAALVDLRALPLQSLSARQALVAVSDRISLGEPALLDALPPSLAEDPAARTHLAGLAALVAGDHPSAEARFVEAAARIDPGQLTGPLRTAWLYAGVAAFEQGAVARAIAHWQQARETARAHAHGRGRLDVEPLLAYAYARLGDAAARDGVLGELAEVAMGERTGLPWLVALRLSPKLALPPPAVTGDAARALVDARRAWAACDSAGARAALQRAELAGIGRGWLAEEARLLAADLDARSDPQPPPRLPYPLFAVWVTRWASASPTAACAPAPPDHS